MSKVNQATINYEVYTEGNLSNIINAAKSVAAGKMDLLFDAIDAAVDFYDIQAKFIQDADMRIAFSRVTEIQRLATDLVIHFQFLMKIFETKEKNFP